jgi:hypothetical protein
MPVYYPMLTLISIVLFAWVGHHLAKKRSRNGIAWGFAGAMVPPLLLVLLLLRPLTADEAEDDTQPEEA